jgi:hypothetical protein
MRADDLDLVYENDLPPDSKTLQELLHTFDHNDPALRNLFRLNLNESLEPSIPRFRTPSRPYARVVVAFDEIQSGIPKDAPYSLKRIIVEQSRTLQDQDIATYPIKFENSLLVARDELNEDDLIVGGDSHKKLLISIFENAKSVVVIHSCFLSGETLKDLLPALEQAAKRKVQIELLWGLRGDPEATSPVKKIDDVNEILKLLPGSIKQRVRLSPSSSGSHAKVIIYDDRETGAWITIVGSCNFLSSDFDWIELSIRTRSVVFATNVMSSLLSNQLPAASNWSATALHLNKIWSHLRQLSQAQSEVGKYTVSLVTDLDHYACVTRARDQAKNDIDIVCDIYGMSAETSVLVPMETAAKRKIEVKLKYTTVSKFLLEEGKGPSVDDLQKRGIHIEKINNMHAKYLGWDDDYLVVTSFNWMATSLGNAAKGSEIGALIEGPNINSLLKSKMEKYLKKNCSKEVMED